MTSQFRVAEPEIMLSSEIAIPFEVYVSFLAQEEKRVAREQMQKDREGVRPKRPTQPRTSHSPSGRVRRVKRQVTSGSNSRRRPKAWEGTWIRSRYPQKSDRARDMSADVLIRTRKSRAPSGKVQNHKVTEGQAKSNAKAVISAARRQRYNRKQHPKPQSDTATQPLTELAANAKECASEWEGKWQYRPVMPKYGPNNPIPRGASPHLTPKQELSQKNKLSDESKKYQAKAGVAYKKRLKNEKTHARNEGATVIQSAARRKAAQTEVLGDALAESKEAIDCLSKAMLTELVQFKEPPPVVLLVMKPVLLMLENERKNYTWDRAQLMMTNVTEFMVRLQDFRAESLTRQQVAKLSKIVADPDFSVATFMRVSAAAGKLGIWVTRVYRYRMAHIKAQKQAQRAIKSCAIKRPPLKKDGSSSRGFSSTKSGSKRNLTIGVDSNAAGSDGAAAALGSPASLTAEQQQAEVAKMEEVLGLTVKDGAVVQVGNVGGDDLYAIDTEDKGQEMRNDAKEEEAVKRPPLKKDGSSSRGFSSTKSGSKRNLTIGVDSNAAGSDGAAAALGSPASKTAEQQQAEVAKMEEVLGLTVKDGAVVQVGNVSKKKAAQTEAANKSGMLKIKVACAHNEGFTEGSLTIQSATANDRVTEKSKAHQNGVQQGRQLLKMMKSVGIEQQSSDTTGGRSYNFEVERIERSTVGGTEQDHKAEMGVQQGQQLLKMMKSAGAEQQQR
jgi:hypothetical protein